LACFSADGAIQRVEPPCGAEPRQQESDADNHDEDRQRDEERGTHSSSIPSGQRSHTRVSNLPLLLDRRAQHSGARHPALANEASGRAGRGSPITRAGAEGDQLTVLSVVAANARIRIGVFCPTRKLGTA
jgi:hypothetical protein